MTGDVTTVRIASVPVSLKKNRMGSPSQITASPTLPTSFFILRFVVAKSNACFMSSSFRFVAYKKGSYPQKEIAAFRAGGELNDEYYLCYVSNCMYFAQFVKTKSIPYGIRQHLHPPFRSFFMFLPTRFQAVVQFGFQGTTFWWHFEKKHNI